jgi:hypothetical protein
MIGAQREAIAHESRRNRLIREPGHDIYRTKGKVSEPTVCPSCAAVYRKGHWQWESSPPVSAAKAMCPACHRMTERIPAGYLTVKGEFLEEHRNEIVHLLRNEESKATAEHALQRIMGIETMGSVQLQVTTTDAHLAKALGDALYRAYRGKLDCQYEETSFTSRVTWER